LITHSLDLDRYKQSPKNRYRLSVCTLDRVYKQLIYFQRIAAADDERVEQSEGSAGTSQSY